MKLDEAKIRASIYTTKNKVNTVIFKTSKGYDFCIQGNRKTKIIITLEYKPKSTKDKRLQGSRKDKQLPINKENKVDTDKKKGDS